MTLPVLSTLPPAPSRLDSPADFVAKADAYLAALFVFRNELVGWAEALPATITGTDFSGTSVSSVAIGTGAKAFTASTGKQWQIGQPVRVANTAAPANFMDGQVTAYNPGTGLLNLNVTAVGGTGTFANWTISLIPGSGAAFATKDGVETLTNKTLVTPGISSLVSGGQTVTIPAVAMTIAGRNNAETLTNKTFSLADNNLGGTLAQFNAALSDGDFATRDGAETLTNKTLSGAIIRADSTVNDTGNIGATSVGFRGIPRSANTTGTIAATDNGKYIPVTANTALPALAGVPDGFSCEIVNESASPVTLTSADTLRWSGTATEGNRILAAYGRAAIGRRGGAFFVSGDVS